MLKQKQQLSKALKAACDAYAPQNDLTEQELLCAIEYPPDAAMGDLAFPCFSLSRRFRRAPQMIASDLAKYFEGNTAFCAEVAGGYLNFRLHREAFAQEVLEQIETQKDRYGADNVGEGKTVVLDYSSPNVAKPFHIGHLGTTVIGHSLKKIFAFSGYRCIGINHLGDWGTQFGKLIVAYRNWGNREEIEATGIDALVALYVRFHAEAEQDPTLNDQARAEFTKLEHHDAANIELWKWFISISLKEYEKTYAQLGITFDSYAGESFYTELMMPQVERLRQRGLLTLDDGASIVDLKEYNMPPCLILKRDGSTLYPTRDIAAAVYRKETYDFDRCIYVTSAGQSLHFAQWFRVVDLAGYDWADQLIHVPYGTVSINGEKLATRTGNVILLRDVFAGAIEKAAEIIEEKNPTLPDKAQTAQAIGVGAIVFYYLSNNRQKDISFVMEDALSFEGNTGPYAQYTYARTCSIMAKAQQMSMDGGAPTCDAEFELLKVLALFAEKVRTAREDYEPSVITRYILSVCAAFNHFYHECQILSAQQEDMRAFRLRLTRATGQVLKNAFDLICLSAPEQI